MAFDEYITAFRSTIICYQSLKGDSKNPITPNCTNHTFTINENERKRDRCGESTVCYEITLSENLSLASQLLAFTVHLRDATLKTTAKQRFSFMLVNDKLQYDTWQCYETEGTYVVIPKENGGFGSKLAKGTYHLILNVEWNDQTEDREV